MSSVCLEVKNISKSYGDLKAVADLSFTVYRGEVFGLLGPNGAGKTTTLEMIEGLRRPDKGQITIDGFDVLKELSKVKEVIGVQLQSTSIYNKIKIGEALRLFGGYYKKRKDVDELLKLVALEDKKHTYHMKLSGGQQQRFALALSLVNDPSIVFLDEPTTGLDPHARHNLWGIIEHMKAGKKTVILTTHYMEEAEKLCDRIAIVDHGRKIAEGTPRELIARLGIDSCLEFLTDDVFGETDFNRLTDVSKVFRKNGQIGLFSKNPQQTLYKLIELAKEKNTEIKDLHIRRPTLEDLFLELTGRSLRE